jgi:hypothetical protein
VRRFRQATIPTPSHEKRASGLASAKQTPVAGFTPTAIGAIMSIMTDRPQKISFGEMRDMARRADVLRGLSVQPLESDRATVPLSFFRCPAELSEE